MSTTNDLEEKTKKLKKYGLKMDFLEMKKMTLMFPQKIFQKILWSIAIKQQFRQ